MGPSTLALVARFWVNQETHGLFDVHSEMVQAINQTASREGIELLHPIQTVRLEKT
jgi:small-conductance mechanosensitive channel